MLVDELNDANSKLTSDLEISHEEVDDLKEQLRKSRIENGMKKVLSEDKAKILKDLISNPLLNTTTLNKQLDNSQLNTSQSQDRSGFLDEIIAK